MGKGSKDSQSPMVATTSSLITRGQGAAMEYLSGFLINQMV